MNKVLIRGLEISACHGVNDFEKTDPQPFIFDADISCDFYVGAMSDDLDGTINYSKACKVIEEVTKNNFFNLIEKLAYECAFTIMEKFERASGVKLTVWKPQAPMKRKFESVGVTVEVSREKVYLSLGSSMGDRKKLLDTAIQKLNALRGVKVEQVSDYIETQPYGGVAQNKFLNCAVCVSSFLTPYQLLNEIHKIEEECGRERKKHWDDRTLDIDIIFFGNVKMNEPDLTIPHRDWENRDFVKIPLKQIAPHLC